MSDAAKASLHQHGPRQLSESKTWEIGRLTKPAQTHLPNAADSSSNTLTRQRENVAALEFGGGLDIEN